MDITKFYAFGDGEEPVRVEMAGREFCEPGYRIRRKASAISVLCYVAGGEGMIRMNGRVYQASAGDIFIIPKGSDHEYWVNPDNPWFVLWFNLTGNLFPMAADAYRLTGQVVFRDECGAKEIFEQGIRICEQDLPDEERQKKLTLTVMEILLNLDGQNRQASAGLEPVCAQIKAALDKRLNLIYVPAYSTGELSRELLLSSRQISRIFKRGLGCTPYEYYTQRKAVLARQYLQNTPMSVKEISQRLGFCDQYYFSNFFKERIGVSPVKYREESR